MARTNSIRNFIVGVVFLGSLLLVGAVTIQVKGLGIFERREEIVVPFDRVNGLKPGDEVRIYGYRVGTVDRIQLNAPTGSRFPLEVTIRLRSGLDLPRGTRFVVRNPNPLGGSVVEINLPTEEARGGAGRTGAPKPAGPKEGGKAEEKGAPASPRETGARSVGWGPAIAWAQEPAGGAPGGAGNTGEAEPPFQGTASPEALEQLGRMIDENRATVKDAIAQIRDAVRAINEREGVLGSILKDPAWRDSVYKSLKNIEEVTDNIKSGKGTIGRLINEPKVFDDLQDISGRIKKVVADLEEGKGTLGRLLKDEALAQDLRDTMADLKDTVAKVNQGEGTIGQLVNNREAWDRLVFVLRQVQDAVEDFREQAPITTFVNSIFQAF
jgi:phospholipid/cholesterol/gamma-HCH transport system substrate-binding protein